ncbi:hypothetical protein KKF84_01535, partial [Myxococcota bacterium]|nr:hypothetical protein [Myxococcota bacterium]
QCNRGEDHFPSRGSRFTVVQSGGLDEDQTYNISCSFFATRETDCDDGTDNDLDGFIDGADPDCAQ